MSSLVYGHDWTVWDWTMRKWGGSVGRQPELAVGILDSEGVLRGALLLHAENKWTAEISVYSEGVITPKVTKEFFRMVFGDLSLHRLQMRTEKTNTQMKRLAPRLGWKFEGVARSYYGPRGDALLFYMTPQTCRWLKTYENAKSSRSARSCESRGRAERAEYQGRAVRGSLQPS